MGISLRSQQVKGPEIVKISTSALLIGLPVLLASISPSIPFMQSQSEQAVPPEAGMVSQWPSTPSPDEAHAPVIEDPKVEESFTDGEKTASIDGAGGYTDEQIAEMQAWVQKTLDGGPPEQELRPGEMWSDQIGLPPNVSKEEADQAEIQIAEEKSEDTNGPKIDGGLAQSQSEIFQTASYFAEPQILQAQNSTNCRTFPFSSHQVCGAILERYVQLGGATSWLLWPTEAMTLNPDGTGYRQRFVNGFIYWSPSTGAHAVTTDSAKVWAKYGWEAGWMGYPLGGEVPVSGSSPIDGETHGWVQIFQGGRIYRTPILGGYQIAVITGAIFDRWNSLGGTQGPLGFPIADEAVAPDGVGRYSIFQQGVIYWHPRYGAWEITGTHLLEWVANGKEQGQYGYPVGPPTDNGLLTGKQKFERGELSQYVEPIPFGGDSAGAIYWEYELSPSPLDDFDF